MPNFVRAALGIALLILVLLLLCAIPLVVALYFGFAWAFIACLPLGALLVWLGGKAGMDGGAEIVIFGGVAVALGLIVGTIWRLLS